MQLQYQSPKPTSKNKEEEKLTRSKVKSLPKRNSQHRENMEDVIEFKEEKQGKQEHIYEPHNQRYFTNSRVLTNTNIRPIDREKLKSWLMSQCSGRGGYYRETYALASRYLDLYFMKGRNIRRQDFQCLGISCLILATKFQERRIPIISLSPEDKVKIFELEIELLRLFEFRLNALTYDTIAEIMMKFWDNFKEKDAGFQNVKFLHESRACLYRYRSVMQTLDCLDLVTETLDIPIVELVKGVFYVQLRKFCLLQLKKTEQQRSINLIADDQNLQAGNIFQSLYAHFVQDLCAEFPMFETKMIRYPTIMHIFQFSRLHPIIEIRNWVNFRHQLCKQTFNPQLRRIARSYIQSRNRT